MAMAVICCMAGNDGHRAAVVVVAVVVVAVVVVAVVAVVTIVVDC
jgi:hypothetical protein